MALILTRCPTTRRHDARAATCRQMGQHRLLCGDSTKTEDVARLRLPERVGCLIFDPPWDIVVPQPPQRWDSLLAFSDGRNVGKVVSLFGSPAWLFVWDCVSSWYTPNRPLKRGKLCLWYGDLTQYEYDGAHYGEPGEQKAVSNTRGSYLYQPDVRGKHLADVFSMAITKLHSQSDSHHSHEKPQDWMRMLIANCSSGLIYDPFAGSGASLITAQSIGREWRGVEIDVRFCDVILQRWKNATGQTAELIKHGS